MPKTLRPSVMRQSEWFKREQRDPEAWKRITTQVKERDHWTCAYCGFRSEKFMQVNHIGAEDDDRLENLELVCKPCHQVLHMGINSAQGYISVIQSDADQVQIVRRTRALVQGGATWPDIERLILQEFLVPGGTIYSREESVELANDALGAIPPDAYRGYLPTELVVVFHEEGPWKTFPETVHRWGIRTKGA